MATAAQVLGRPHRVDGVVERGDQRGRELGYPTANLRTDAWTADPADGVYAGGSCAWTSGAAPSTRRRWAPRPSRSAPTPRSRCGSAGSRPTSSTSPATCTAPPSASSSSQRLRGMERFDSVDALVDADGRRRGADPRRSWLRVAHRAQRSARAARAAPGRTAAVRLAPATRVGEPRQRAGVATSARWPATRCPRGSTGSSAQPSITRPRFSSRQDPVGPSGGSHRRPPSGRRTRPGPAPVRAMNTVPTPVGGPACDLDRGQRHEPAVRRPVGEPRPGLPGGRRCRA